MDSLKSLFFFFKLNIHLTQFCNSQKLDKSSYVACSNRITYAFCETLDACQTSNYHCYGRFDTESVQQVIICQTILTLTPWCNEGSGAVGLKSPNQIHLSLIPDM